MLARRDARADEQRTRTTAVGAHRDELQLEVNGRDDVSIIDLGSTKGTFVNGQKVNKAKLQSGDGGLKLPGLGGLPGFNPFKK